MNINKIVLITGASSEVGKETAKLLINSGYTVYATAKRVEKIDPLKESGIHTLFLDIADDTSIVEGVQQIIKKEKRIDILINNAEFASYGAVEEVPINIAKYQLNVNLIGQARLIQLVLPYMRNQHYGKIVNISSIGSKIATPLSGWFYASKLALEGLSDSLRMEVKSFGIDVILIEPGKIFANLKKNLYKVSTNTAYKSLIEKKEQLLGDEKPNSSIEIAELIKKVIEVRSPKSRYVKGYLSNRILFLYRWFADRMFNKSIMKQFG